MLLRIRNINLKIKHGFIGMLTGFLSLTLTITTAKAEEISFIVQPIYSEVQTREVFKPLAQYLSQATGHRIKLVTTRSFQEYWNKIQKGTEYDLVLDAAHFTSYRAKYHGYNVIAKLPDTVTFSLISNSSDLFLDPDDLIGKSLVTQSPPSLAALRLEQMYPNPMRLPVTATSDSAVEAIELVSQGKVTAAIVPTPLLKDYEGIHVITTTQPVPHMAFSTSPALDRKIAAEIRRVLVNAKNTKAGRQVLESIKFAKFELSNNRTYEGYDKLLRHTWGYALVNH